jgi:putative oxidoreductase
MAASNTLNHHVLNLGHFIAHFETLNRILDRLAEVAVVPGRLLLALIFLQAGLSKITGWEMSAGYMSAHGMPLVPLFLAGAIAVEVLGGLALLLGWQTRLVGLIMAVYLVPVTLIFHNFWAAAPGMEYMMQHTNFMKNLSIIGGLLMVFSLGGGGYSLDAWREKKRT